MADKNSSHINSLKRYISLTWHIAWLNISAAMEYRVSFLTQVIGIVINDLSYLLIWTLFFKSFPIINGWQIHDMLLLMAVFFVIFGTLETVFGGGTELAKYITKGELDYFLTFPKNVLWHSTMSRSDIAGIGDMILGIVIFLFLSGPLTLEKIIVYLIVTTFAFLILFNFVIITQSLAFYVGNFEESADRWLWTLFGVALYPQTIFSGWIKVVTLTVLPTFFIIYLPVSLLNHFSWQPLLLIIGFWLLTSGLALLLFYRGLRRYESGNLINVRI